jgi:hypothetical protein
VDPLFLDALAFAKDLEARTGVGCDARAYLADLIGHLAAPADRARLSAELAATTDDELETAKAGSTWPT